MTPNAYVSIASLGLYFCGERKIVLMTLDIGKLLLISNTLSWDIILLALILQCTDLRKVKKLFAHLIDVSLNFNIL
jgi:hypothetical protein